MTLAIDFDGTIVEHRYPDIGRERPFAVATLRQLQREDPDLRLILWTVRQGALLQEAVDWCAARGLHFFAVNSNYPGEQPPAPEPIAPAGTDTTGTALPLTPSARKITADFYIDDRNLLGIPSWPDIYRRLAAIRTTNPAPGNADTAAPAPAEKKSLLSRLLSRK